MPPCLILLDHMIGKFAWMFASATDFMPPRLRVIHSIVVDEINRELLFSNYYYLKNNLIYKYIRRTILYTVVISEGIVHDLEFNGDTSMAIQKENN